MRKENRQDVEVAREFFEELFGKAKAGHLVIWTKRDKLSRFFKVDALDQAATAAAILSESDDVYFGVGLQEEELESKQRGKESGVVAVPGFWVDIDVLGPNHKGKDLPPTLEDGLRLLEAVPLKPSMLVRTGGGIHAYWLLREPKALNEAEERKRFKQLVKRLQELIRKRCKAKGWKLDNTSDLARVLRIPGTWNRKGQPVKVEAEFSGCRYTEEQLRTALDQAEQDPFDCDEPSVPEPPSPLDATDKAKPAAKQATEATPEIDELERQFQAEEFMGVPRSERIYRFKAYLFSDKYPESIQGDDGDGRMLHAVAARFRFGVTKKDAWPVLQEFNDSKCDPKWNETEMRHKFDEAKPEKERDEQGRKRFPIGCYLDPDWKPADGSAAQQKDRKDKEQKKPNLPPLSAAYSFLGDQTPKAIPDIWHGVLHVGDKLFLGGPSKARKSFSLMLLSLCVCTGREFWGKPTAKNPVLYLNLELRPESFWRRLDDIRSAMGIESKDLEGKLHVWHLRGHALPIEELAPELVKAAGRKFGLIVIDPVYKVLGNRSENDAGQMASLCNLLEQVGKDTGAAIAAAFHFAKGNASMKEAMDRVSGSGVIARDPDALVTLTPHANEECFAVEAIVRDHPPVKPFVVRWDYPLMKVDGSLSPTNLKKPQKPGGNPATDEDVRAALKDEEFPLTKDEVVNKVKKRTGCSVASAKSALEATVAKGCVELVLTKRPGTNARKQYKLTQPFKEEVLR